MYYSKIYIAVQSKIDLDLAFADENAARKYDTERAKDILLTLTRRMDSVPSRDSNIGRAIMFLGELIAEQAEPPIDAAAADAEAVKIAAQ